MGQVSRPIQQVATASKKIRLVFLIMEKLGILRIWAHLALPATFEFWGGKKKTNQLRVIQPYMGLREAKKEERVLEIQYKPDHFSSLLAHVW